MPGGIYTLGYTRSSTDHTTNINFSPVFTKFTSDRKAANVKLLFTLISGKQTQGSITQQFTDYNIGVGASGQNLFALATIYQKGID